MNIPQLRAQIDALDVRLVRLLSKRAKLSLVVGRLKKRAGMPLFIHKREREIAHNVTQANRGPLSGKAMRHLFEQILQQTRAMVRAELRRESTNSKHGTPPDS